MGSVVSEDVTCLQFIHSIVNIIENVFSVIFYERMVAMFLIHAQKRNVLNGVCCLQMAGVTHQTHTDGLYVCICTTKGS